MKDPLNNVVDLPSFWNDAIPFLQKNLLLWYKNHGRQTLPWKSKDPYMIWISEIMLQQTQVITVIPKFKKWMESFPTIESLAQSPQDSVLKCWEGLGYYSRARNIHFSAQIMHEKWNSKMPTSRVERLSLKGVGPSTASAIGAFAFGKREAIYDGNVRRVWFRWWGDRVSKEVLESEKEATAWGWAVAQSVTPEKSKDIKEWTQAIMDLGATVCLSKNPKCSICPFNDTCRAYALKQQHQYPPPKKKTLVKNEEVSLFWVTNHKGEVGILPPENQGKWSGLWKLPEWSNFNLEIPIPSTLKSLAQGKHLLTHRKISWSLNQIKSEDFKAPNLIWVNQLGWDEKAWPGFIRKWWESLTDKEKAKFFGLKWTQPEQL